jgi:hypothetical protein
MLNETQALYRSLEQNQCDLPESHPDVKEPGRHSGYRVGLGQDGLPLAIEEIDPDTMASLWTIREGKHNSFPVVNIQHALLQIPAEASLRRQLADLKKQQAAERIALLQDALRHFPAILGENDAAMWQRLRDRARELQPLFSGQDKRFEALPELMRRFTENPLDPKAFLERLAHRLVERLAAARLDDAALAEKLLIGKYKKRDPHAKAEVRLVLDAAGEFPTRVATTRMRYHVSRCLASGGSNAEQGRCALTGEQQALLSERSPEPKLPALGETKFFSMNPDTPCQRRYGLTGLRAFRLGQSTAHRLEKAIKFITDEAREGKTWRRVPNGKFEVKGGRKMERSDLLIVYVDGEPVIDANVASCFGDDAREAQKQFAVDAEEVCKAFAGIAERRPESRLYLFLIRKADKEKKQVVLVETPTVREVLEAARWWQRAGANVPEITVPLAPKEKGQRAIQGHPQTPRPATVVRLLSESWVRGGLQAVKVESVGFAQVLELMLRTRSGWEQALCHILKLTLARLGALFCGLFGALLTEKEERWQKYPNHARQSALIGARLLGIVLDALGRRKETYMVETAFLVGRLLALADTLHREYCRHVRKGDIPPQLIGNALMPVAAVNPKDAVARLGQRLPIYKAWADQKEGEQYRLAKWAVARMGEICQQLPRPMLAQVDQTFQAELFLGYMARSPRGAEQGEGDSNSSLERGE